MATENIMMYCVKTKNGDRQVLHEAIRQHSVKAAEQVKLYGKKNDLLERIKADDTFGLSEEEIEMLMQPETFTGMAEHQCEMFLTEVVAPVLEQCKEEPSVAADINV